MIAVIDPSAIVGNIKVPASKSAMQRACALALLNNGQTIIHNPGVSNDEIAAINIIKSLGAKVISRHETLTINSDGKLKPSATIDCGESGLSLRMFAPIAALSDSAVLLNGSGSLLKRQMHFIDEVFPKLKVKTVSNHGYLPIQITGPLQPGNISIDGSESSQYLTGLLFAFARQTKEQVCIHVTNLKSTPYIDLSLQMLDRFGYDVSHDGYQNFYVKPVYQKEKSVSYYTEADWSSASFLIVAGAIAGNISLTGLDMHSVQADRAIIDVLHLCNASFKIVKDILSINTRNPLQAFEF
ncbi:MAG: 3-phosphoshikimate 1-carboxyvinyltransferase, partial [Ferruginibacter sp.]